MDRRDTDWSYDLSRAHLRVSTIGVVVAAISVVFTAIGALAAIGLLHHDAPTRTAPPQLVATTVSTQATRVSERRRPPGISISSELHGNARLAERYREARLWALQRADEQLRRFVTTRTGVPVPCDAVRSVSQRTTAALRCEVDGVQVSFVRLSSKGAADDYFGDRLSASVSHTWVGAKHVCNDWWSTWTDGAGRRIGYLASRLRGGRALIVWSYDRHCVVAIASVPKSGGGRLCDAWFANA